MEKVADTYRLRKVWRSKTWIVKTKGVEDVGGVLGQLSDVKSDAIGSIYQLNAASCRERRRCSEL
jgi:hypothetical protein